MIDFHMHTTASDGAYTPAELLAECEKANLKLISITDHYSVDGYRDLQDPEIRKLFSGEIITGCELNCHYKGYAMEILGYGFEPEDAAPYITEHYPSLEEKARLELEDLFKIYRERGFPFDEEEVRNAKHPGRFALWKNMLKYPENRALVTRPEALEQMMAYQRWELGNPESPFYRPLDNVVPTAKEIVDFYHSLGGVAVVAHPGSYDRNLYEMMENLILDVKPDGLEVWYPCHTEEMRDYLMGLCQKHGLFYSRGSDYHHEKRAQSGYVLGTPQFDGIAEEKDIFEWTDKLKKI